MCLQNEESLCQMESDIRAAQEAALEAVETDSIMTGTSANPEDSSLFGSYRRLVFCPFVAMIVKILDNFL